MNIPSFFSNVGHALQRNSPAILTALGVAGVGATAYLAHNAGGKTMFWMASRAQEAAHGAFEDGEDTTPDQLWTPRELIEENWRHYVPVVLSGASAIACIIAAHTVHSRRHAALLSAYALAERAIVEYREKTEEVVGKEKAEEIRDGVLKDRMGENPPTEDNTIIISGKEDLCYDAHSGRYWKCDMHTLEKAEIHINRKINQHMYSSVNEFWAQVGLPALPMGESMGWNSDHPLELRYVPWITEDGRPALAVEFRKQPVMDYYSLT